MNPPHTNRQKNKPNRTESEPRKPADVNPSTSREISNANLIPFDKMTPERLLFLSAKGGKASGEARRKKRDQIEARKVELMAQIEAENEAETKAAQNRVDEIRELRDACHAYRLMILAERYKRE